MVLMDSFQAVYHNVVAVLLTRNDISATTTSQSNNLDRVNMSLLASKVMFVTDTGDNGLMVASITKELSQLQRLSVAELKKWLLITKREPQNKESHPRSPPLGRHSTLPRDGGNNRYVNRFPDKKGFVI